MYVLAEILDTEGIRIVQIFEAEPEGDAFTSFEANSDAIEFLA